MSNRDTKHLTFEELWILDGGWVTNDDEWLRGRIAQALSKIPAEDAKLTYDKCLFLMPRERERGSYIPNKFVRDKNLVLFPEALTGEPKARAERTILHEVAHFLLGHKMPLLEGLSLDEGMKQEREAEMLVKRWTKRKDWQ